MKKTVGLMILGAAIAVTLVVRFALRNQDQIAKDKLAVVHVKPGEKDFQFTLNNVLNNYTGAEKVKLLTQLAKDLLIDERALFINSVGENLKKESLETNILVASELANMKLKPEEIMNLAKATCGFKKSNEDFHKLTIAFKESGVSLETICQ